MLAGLVSRTTHCSHFECSCHGVTTQGCCELARLAHALEEPLLYIQHISLYYLSRYLYLYLYLYIYIYIHRARERERERRNRISQACSEQTEVEDRLQPVTVCTIKFIDKQNSEAKANDFWSNTCNTRKQRATANIQTRGLPKKAPH